jgi:beta-glucanase (GH16 family)
MTTESSKKDFPRELNRLVPVKIGPCPLARPAAATQNAALMADKRRNRRRPYFGPVRGLILLLAVAACGIAVGASTAGGARINDASGPWTLAFSDDFSDGVQSSHWGKYSGQPGGNPGGWWAPSHVTASGGIARLSSYRDSAFGNRWVSGGISSASALMQTYGKWEVRLRMDNGYGIWAVILLWPKDGWPPEVDFYEDGGGTADRREMAATLHHSPSNQTIQRTLREVDFSQWHTVGVEWSPGSLVYTVDGSPWASVSGPQVPSQPMWLGMQTQAGTCGVTYAPCPNGTTPATVEMQIDWARAWRYDPSAGGPGSAPAPNPTLGPPAAGPAGGGRPLRAVLSTRRRISLSTIRRRGIPASIGCSRACTARLTAHISSAAARSLGLDATGKRWHVIGRQTRQVAGGRSEGVRLRVPELRIAQASEVSRLPLSLVLSATDDHGSRHVLRRAVTIEG